MESPSTSCAKGFQVTVTSPGVVALSVILQSVGGGGQFQTGVGILVIGYARSKFVRGYDGVVNGRLFAYLVFE